MNTDEQGICHLCRLPIAKGLEVLLLQKQFHPNCAVTAAKENKHGRNADNALRGPEGDETGVVSHADTACN